MVLGVRTRNSFRGAVPARGQKYSREIESLAPGTLGPGVPDPDHTVGKILSEDGPGRTDTAGPGTRRMESRVLDKCEQARVAPQTDKRVETWR